MPVECACIRTGHTLNAVYKITNVPVLQKTTLLAFSIATGYEPGNRYYLNSQDPSYDLFHHLQKRASRTLNLVTVATTA